MSVSIFLSPSNRHSSHEDISFNREASLLLAEEISSRGDNLCIIIRILEDSYRGLSGGNGGIDNLREIGDAIVELYVMIEDSCSIVRQVDHLPTLRN